MNCSSNYVNNKTSGLVFRLDHLVTVTTQEHVKYVQQHKAQEMHCPSIQICLLNERNI